MAIPNRFPMRFGPADHRSWLLFGVVVPALSTVVLAVTWGIYFAAFAMGVSTLVGLVAWFARPSANWYVELGVHSIVIHTLATNRVRYADVETAEGNRDQVRIHLRRWLWITLIPPVVTPRTVLTVTVDGGEELARTLQERVYATKLPADGDH